MNDPVPLLIVTGFLGAGKTTVLNRVLGAQHARRIAVVVNELGRIDIDTKLIRSRAGDVMELVGGCVCHEVRVQSELWAAIAELVARSQPEVVVLETTGIAEPWAILDGLDAMGARAAPVAAAGVICVVDAEAGARQLERHEEARAQAEAADRILLSKLDLATPGQLADVHRLLGQRNADAERAGFPVTADGTAALIPWLLDTEARAARSGARRHRHAAPPHQHGQLVAAVFSDEAPLLAEPLLQLCERLGDALVRAKGFVNLAGEARRGFLERAGARTTLRYAEAWGDGERRRTDLVLIGEGLDEGALRRQIWACRVAAG
jgi:G3E family GTPase